MTLRVPTADLMRAACHTDRIDLSSPRELSYWASQWGVAPEQIVKAVALVGPNLRLVRRECAAGVALRA